MLNNAQSRGTSAMNAKLDALIVALEKADNRMVGLELKPDSDAKVLSDEIHKAGLATASGEIPQN